MSVSSALQFNLLLCSTCSSVARCCKQTGAHQICVKCSLQKWLAASSWRRNVRTCQKHVKWHFFPWYLRLLAKSTSSARTSRGRKFQRKKSTSQRKNLPIECAQGDRPARCPNHFFAVNKPSAVPWWWCDLFWCHEVACGVRWSTVLGCEVTWGELLWFIGHVMSCHLMRWSCHLMRCDCLCCVMSRDAMRCHVMRAHVNSSATPYYKVLLQYCSVLQSTTPVLLCTTKYYSSTTLYYKVHYSSTTPYYKVLLQCYSVLQSTLLQYYSVLQSTTPVLLCTTKYYSSTKKYYSTTTPYYKVRQSTTPVLLRTTKYYSSATVLQSTTPVLQSTTPLLLRTTKYYSNTTPYYKVLQRTTPVLLCTTKHYSSTTPYYKVLLQCYSVLQSTTLYYKVLLRYYFETSFTMRGATGISLQPH